MTKLLKAIVCPLCVAIVGGLAAERGTAQTIIDSPPTIFPFPGFATFSGDVVLNVRDGAQIFVPISANNGGTINLLGDEITQGIGVGDQGHLNISDGLIGGLTDGLSLTTGSHTTIRGGRMTRPMLKQTAAELVIEGFDFELGGVPIPGLDAPGNETSVTIPINTFFAGAYANGEAFTFFGEPTGGDRLFGNIILRSVTPPQGGPVIYLPGDPKPPGILPGQTVILNDGASLPAGTNGPRGSIVRVEGGTLSSFEAYHSKIEVAAGIGGTITAYEGANIRIHGGSTRRVAARQGSQVLMDGGTLDFLNVFSGSSVELRGGVLSNAQVLNGAEMLMTGGQIVDALSLAGSDSKFRLVGGSVLSDITIRPGSLVIIEGGSVRTIDQFGIIFAGRDSEMTIVGRSFKLSGVNVAGLVNPGDSVLITQRDGQTLDAVLRDGSPLKLFVGNARSPQQVQRTYIDPLATLRLILVPEPGSAFLTSLTAGALYSRRRRSLAFTAQRGAS